VRYSASQRSSFLAIGVIFFVLPWIGLELLDTAPAIAEFDLLMLALGGA
jgi:hypothetical protein